MNPLMNNELLDIIFYIGIGLIVVPVFLIFEYNHLISETAENKRRLTVYSKKLRVCFKIAVMALDVVIIAAGLLAPK